LSKVETWAKVTAFGSACHEKWSTFYGVNLSLLSDSHIPS
jgi:hypothetical protein